MSSIISLDVGKTRVGVAKASLIARLPAPYATLTNGPDILTQIQGILDTESVGLIVVGLPRNLAGEETEQTGYTRQFAKQLETMAKIVFQDEALTSVKAEKELVSRGKPFVKGDIDALAATYILEDYLQEHRSNS